jgi:hypothetical protein
VVTNPSIVAIIASDARDGPGANRDVRGRFLREGIGRHDRASRHWTLVGAERGERDRQAGPDACDRQRHADHAGRRDEHLLDGTADEASGQGRHVPRRLDAFVAGAGVRAPAVDDDGSGCSAGTLEMLA